MTKPNTGIRRIETPFVFTIFGASGDLAKLKIFPSLFELAEQKRFRSDFVILGYARRQQTDEGFRKDFETSIRKAFEASWDDRREKILKGMLDQVFYFQGQYDQDKDYQAYTAFRDSKLQNPKENFAEVFYFSVPPVAFEPIVRGLKSIEDRCGEMKLVMEKPFGEDTHSARHLFHVIDERFSEDQIFLLDHYLGKKTVRSILPLRSSNRLLQNVMNGREIANIQITALEPFGVAQRLGYFDRVGIIKDFIQSHLLQLLSLLTMNIPVDQSSYAIHQEKQAVINSLYFSPDPKNLILGQYESYQSHDPSVKNSETPTFAALKFYFNRQDWYKVPIYIRAGKMVDRRHTYLMIELEKHPYQTNEPNRIVIEIAPNQEIRLTIVDEDDHSQEVNTIKSSGSLACQGDYCLPEHALLLLDVLNGERSHFVSFGEILSSWKIIDEVMVFAQEQKVPIENYADGSQGPKNQNRLMGERGFEWH